MLRDAPLYPSHSTSPGPAQIHRLRCWGQKRQLDLLLTQPNHPEREGTAPPPSSLLCSVVPGQGNTLGQSWRPASSRPGCRRLRLPPGHAPLPTAGPHGMDKPEEQLWRTVIYSPLSSDRVNLLKQREVVIFSWCFFFSQGFPKWMAVKDFNILQAQQLILKSLAEGSYRGKLGCKSFWRLFPFWNL